MENEKLYSVMKKQSDILDEILVEQEQVRQSVVERDWDTLQKALNIIDDYSSAFCSLECERESYSDESSFPELRREVKSKLLKSKIANDSLNEYLKITNDFLQGLFDNVIPNRRNVLYCTSGILKNQPECMVLDAVL